MYTISDPNVTKLTAVFLGQDSVSRLLLLQLLAQSPLKFQPKIITVIKIITGFTASDLFRNEFICTCNIFGRKTSITIRSNKIKGHKTLLVINMKHKLLMTPKTSELSSSQVNISMNLYHSNNSKGKEIPAQAYYKPREFREVEGPRFPDNRHMKAVRLSARRTGRPGNIPSTYFC